MGASPIGSGTISGAIGCGCDFGASEASSCDLTLVSILSCLAFIPDNRRSRTPGIELLVGRLFAVNGVPFGCGARLGFDDTGGGGRAPNGGGCIGGGKGCSLSCEAIEGSVSTSATVDSDVAAVVGLEPIELTHVRPEKLLESD